jgi:hypothetical protein
MNTAAKMLNAGSYGATPAALELYDPKGWNLRKQPEKRRMSRHGRWGTG